MRLACRVFLVVAALYSASVTPLCAQHVDSTHFQQRKTFFDGLLKERQGRIHRWENEANLELFLLVVIAVFGGATAALQASKAKWSKICTTIMGAAVGTLTVINANAFDGDRKTLLRMVNKGDRLIEASEDTLSKISSDMAFVDQETLFKEVQTKLNQIIDLEGSVEPDSATSTIGAMRNTNLLDELSPALHAAEQSGRQTTQRQPQWVSQSPPDDDVYRYFVGQATASSVTDAKSQSYDAALGVAVVAVSRGISPQLNIVSYVANILTVVDSFFTVDSVKRQCTYWTLVRIPKLVSGTQATQQLAAAIHTPKSFSFNYQFSPQGKQGRYWSEEAGIWMERSQNDPTVSVFKVTGRARVETCSGTLALSSDRAGFEVFIPDIGCNTMWLRFRTNNGPWQVLGQMMNIES